MVGSVCGSSQNRGIKAVKSERRRYGALVEEFYHFQLMVSLRSYCRRSSF